MRYAFSPFTLLCGMLYSVYRVHEVGSYVATSYTGRAEISSHILQTHAIVFALSVLIIDVMFCSAITRDPSNASCKVRVVSRFSGRRELTRDRSIVPLQQCLFRCAWSIMDVATENKLYKTAALCAALILVILTGQGRPHIQNLP